MAGVSREDGEIFSQEESKGERHKEGSDGGSTDEFDSGSDGEEDVPKEDDAVYEDVKLEELSHPALNTALYDDESELWLVRVPRHDALRTGIRGTDIPVVDARELETSAVSDEIAGLAKGYYVYRECGIVDDGMRATFVAKDATGEMKLQVGKPFTRSINITFDVPMKSLGVGGPPPRKYPAAPEGQRLKYFPIGSSGGVGGAKIAQPEAAKQPAQTTTPPSNSMSSPTKRRRVAPRKEHMRSPRSLRSQQQANGVQPSSTKSPRGIPVSQRGKKAQKAVTSPRKQKRRVKSEGT